MKIKLYCMFKGGKKNPLQTSRYRQHIKVPSYDAMYRTRGDNPSSV